MISKESVKSVLNEFQPRKTFYPEGGGGEEEYMHMP